MVNNWPIGWLPRRCVLCATAGQADLCADCLAELPRITAACQRCGLPLPTAALCGECLRRPPPFTHCLSPFLYQAPISQLITRFKYEGQFSHGRALSRQLLNYLRELAPPAVDVLLPVPLHWRRRWSRGFNQAEIIADELGRALKLPVQTRWLRRLRSAPPQQGLDAAQRSRNLRAAFSVRGPLAGLHVALVDDVVTTGATSAELSRVLLAAGADSVQVWCLARTP